MKTQEPTSPPHPHPYYRLSDKTEPRPVELSAHLSDYYYILVKHKWLIVTATLACLGITTLYLFWMQPVYSTQAILAMNNDQIRAPLTGEALIYQSDISQVMAFNTHMSLIDSRSVLEQVIRKLKLDQIAGLQTMETRPLRQIVNQFKSNLYLLTGRTEATEFEPPGMDSLVSMLRNKIETSEVRDTLLMEIRVEDHDPAMARDIANTLAEVYIQFDIANRQKTSNSTVSWMSDQLYEMKKKLQDAEQEFLAYKQNEKLFSMAGRQGQISKKIDEFNDAYIRAKNKRIELDVKLKELDRISGTKKTLHVRTLVDNPLISDLYRQLVDGEVELSRMKKVYKSKHPKMIQLTTRIDKTRKKLNDELDKELANLKTERALLVVKEGSLQKSVADFENEAMSINNKELKYTILERNVETYGQLYDTLLSKLKQPSIMDNAESSNLYIAEAAVTPHKPIRPRKKLSLMLGLLLGLMNGVGFSFLWEYLDRSIRTEEDVRKYLDLPVLSVIPKAEKAKDMINYGN